jgi:hypothetical protein
MTVNQDTLLAYTYQEASIIVETLDKLPPKIQKQINVIMEESFWEFKDSLYFINAQVVDIEKYLEDGDPHKKHWVVPRYELNFYLRNSSIGIHRYNITIHLDDYGQILKINWPREGAGGKKMFLARKTVQEFALKEAKKRGYKLQKFEVRFEYNEEFSRLCWEFSFLDHMEVGAAYYNFIKVPWDELIIIDSTQEKK